jgi:hypothetical protein
MVIQRMKANGACFHHVGCGIEWTRDAIAFLGSINTATRARLSFYQDPVLSNLIIHQFVNTVILDDADEELLKVIFSAFGFIERPETEIGTFWLYVFLYLGQPLIYAVRCAAELSSVLATSDEWNCPTCVLQHLCVLDTKRWIILSERYFKLLNKKYIVCLAPQFLKYWSVTKCLPDTIAWYVNHESEDNKDVDIDNREVSVDDENEEDNKQCVEGEKVEEVTGLLAQIKGEITSNVDNIQIKGDITCTNDTCSVVTDKFDQICVCCIQHSSKATFFWIQCNGCDRWYQVSSFCVGLQKLRLRMSENGFAPVVVIR